MIILNSLGQETEFDQKKIVRSLERVGSPIAMINEILYEVEEHIRNSKGLISTKQIYKLAFKLLKKKESFLAARYSLKKAILDLGPSGYPFEVLVAKLIETQGYKIEVGKIMNGHCVQHEVDVYATKGPKAIFVECKFHKDFTRKNGVKIPLYVHARYMDLKKEWHKKNGNSDALVEGWVVTNTHFSEDAISYANCKNMKLVAWNYPRQGNLKDRIDYSGLHPITCLTGLTISEKKYLLEKKIVLVSQLLSNEYHFEKMGINDRRKGRIIKEAEKVISAY